MPGTTPEVVAFVTASLRERLANALLQVEIDANCMEEAPRAGLYANSCWAGYSYVEPSLGLGTQCIYVSGVLSRDGVDPNREIVELELCDSAHDRTADRKAITTINGEGGCSTRCFGGTDIRREVHAATRNRTIRNLHAGGSQSNSRGARRGRKRVSKRSQWDSDESQRGPERGKAG